MTERSDRYVSPIKRLHVTLPADHPKPTVNIPTSKLRVLVGFLNALLGQLPSGVVYETDFNNMAAIVRDIRTEAPTIIIHIHADTTFDENVGCYLAGANVPSPHKENVETGLRLMLEAAGMRWSFNPVENTLVVWFTPDADATPAPAGHTGFTAHRPPGLVAQAGRGPDRAGRAGREAGVGMAAFPADVTRF